MAKKPKPRAVDWREETLDRIRALILEADPKMIEERKWRKPSNGMAGVPVWSHYGIVCTGETYKNAVKVTFARGAELKDPSRLFNSSLDGNVQLRRLRARPRGHAHRPPRMIPVSAPPSSRAP